MEDMKEGCVCVWNLKMHTLAYVKPVIVSLVTCVVSSKEWGCLFSCSNDEWPYKKL